MEHFLWIGSYMDESLYKEMRGMGYKNPASYQSQKNLLDALEKTGNFYFHILSVLSMNGFPTDKTIIVHKKVFGHDEKRGVMAGYLNVKYLNRVFSARALVRETKKWIKNINHQDIVYVFVYEMRSACLSVLQIIKKWIPNSKVYLIVPDLPQYMDLKMNKMKRLLKKIDGNIIRKNLVYVDKYILYAKPMADVLAVNEDKWMLMEGAINVEELEAYDVAPVQSDKIIIMYSGGTQLGFGMEYLLKAFDFLDDSYELWITGSGDAKSLIESYARKNHRIKYFGFLDTREELVSLQHKATALINMRNPNADSSNYCFPSKLFEYMLTGKPVLSFRMGGIPDEYYDFLYIIDDFSAEGIAKSIRGLKNYSENEMEKKAADAKYFIINYKNNYSQAQRILKFIKD